MANSIIKFKMAAVYLKCMERVRIKMHFTNKSSGQRNGNSSESHSPCLRKVFPVKRVIKQGNNEGRWIKIFIFMACCMKFTVR